MSKTQMITRLSKNTDVLEMLSVETETSAKTTLRKLKVEELQSLCEQFGINVDEPTPTANAVLQAVAGVQVHVTPKGDQVGYVLATIEKATKNNDVIANYDGKQLLISNKDLGYLVKKGVLTGNIPVKVDTISPNPAIPGWYQGQVLSSIIPELLKMIAYRDEQASELAQLRKALRTAKLPKEEIDKRVGDRMEADIPRSKCPF